MTESFDRAAIKALRESLDIAASMTYSGGGYRYCEVDPDELAQAIDALAALDEAERRIAAMLRYADEQDPDHADEQPLWPSVVRAALHPVAETTESEKNDE